MYFYSVLNQVTQPTATKKTNKQKLRKVLFNNGNVNERWIFSSESTPFELNTLALVIACAEMLAQKDLPFVGVFVGKWIIAEWSKKATPCISNLPQYVHASTFKLKRFLCLLFARWGHCHWNCSAHTERTYVHTLTYKTYLCICLCIDIEKMFSKEWIAWVLSLSTAAATASPSLFIQVSCA